MRRHDLTNKKTKMNIFWDCLQRAIPKTCDLWDIWSAWGGEMTWPKKKIMTKTDTKKKTKTMTKTFREHLQRAIPETCDLCNIWSEWWRDMTRPKRETITMTNTETKTMSKTKIFREYLQRAIPETCEIWDTDYNFDNWEPGFMTICVTWQLRVTLDSIRNSCDVLHKQARKSSEDTQVAGYARFGKVWAG